MYNDFCILATKSMTNENFHPDGFFEHDFGVPVGNTSLLTFRGGEWASDALVIVDGTYTINAYDRNDNELKIFIDYPCSGFNIVVRNGKSNSILFYPCNLKYIRVVLIDNACSVKYTIVGEVDDNTKIVKWFGDKTILDEERFMRVHNS